MVAARNYAPCTFPIPVHSDLSFDKLGGHMKVFFAKNAHQFWMVFRLEPSMGKSLSLSLSLSLSPITVRKDLLFSKKAFRKEDYGDISPN